MMGMSPEGVASALQDLLTCGSQYVRLVEFSRPPRIDSHYHAGLVFQVRIVTSCSLISSNLGKTIYHTYVCGYGSWDISRA